MEKNVRILWVMFHAMLCAFAGPTAAAPDAAAGRAKAAACGACHGADGNSVAPEWPRLAGQVPQYLTKQLRDFKAGRRNDQTMGPMAQSLREQDIEDLAAYFSTQKIQAGAGRAEAQAPGREIYEKGRHRPKVLACIGCHGPAGAGNRDWGKTMAVPPTMLAPALGGQQAGYVLKQLKAYQRGERANDVGQVMRGIVAQLSEADMAAVAEYAAALRP